MKKRFIYYFTLFASILACSDDFTEIEPIGALSEEVLASEGGVELLLIATYSALDGRRNNAAGNGFAQTGDNWWLDALSDDAHKGSTDDDQDPLYQMEIHNGDAANGYPLGQWSSLFAGVNRANAAISAGVAAQEAGSDISAKLGEARFLRGHFNFQLQRMFGNVPYISEENTANQEFNIANSGPIWSQIEADFQYAVDNLPDARVQAGRPESWTAKAYLGKVLLQQNKWAPALTLLKDVIENGPFSLNAEFLDNFNAAGENSAESLFAIQFLADKAQSPNGNIGGVLNFPNPGPFGSCCGFYQPSQDLVNAFRTDANGLPLLDDFNAPGNDVANDFGMPDDDPFTPEAGTLDPRLDYTVGRRGIDYNGYGPMPGQSWIRAQAVHISGPYLPAKNVYQASEQGIQQGTGGWGQQHSGINYNVMRFADVLLMGAEAAAEVGGAELANALTWVNMVRNRAKNTTYVMNEAGDAPAANYLIEPYDDFADQATAIKAVRHERRLELGMEGHRLFDLRRWGNAEEIMNAYIQNEGRTIPGVSARFLPYTSKHDLLPIPISAIDVSAGALTQNPGW
ncbi:RagB/SusD family nutrient uptake outer membrane protein [Maribacter sp. 2308TA10-17]|uniref:RagB/SusD family nutrient uptake outer membrane protein n=1 Tax=Maribacter sp. 2308TA10-17 TaxID=3386276 RepID=UPI0039BCFD09